MAARTVDPDKGNAHGYQKEDLLHSKVSLKGVAQDRREAGIQGIGARAGAKGDRGAQGRHEAGGEGHRNPEARIPQARCEACALSS